MIRIKVFKASQLLYGAAVVVLCLLIIGLGIGYLVNKNNGAGQSATPRPNVATTAPTTTPEPTDQVELDDTFAADMDDMSAANVTNAFAQKTAQLSKWLMDVDFLDPMSVLTYQFPALEEMDAVPVNAEPDEFTPDAPDDVERIEVEIAEIKERYKPPVKAEEAKFRVLIYSTHSYEAYEQDVDNPYKETSQWRTADMDFNILGVGAELKRQLEALGIEVVHDLTEHEPPKLGTAYTRSLKTLEKYAVAGESFDMMIDLHRDAASSNNTNPSSVLVDGRPTARLMMLIGTGEDGFQIKPNWKENYKLAQALTDELNGLCENLTRDVMVKTGRYNQHMGESAVLIEVGHNKNTLEEAMNATIPLAKAIHAVLNGSTGAK